ncbi:polysaccharide pyruvyl transferase family protein [Amaricoccus macauensis]|uniref:polysaccharide pyruvyl transferase family protein n=1 Tax=Amaricoccus macauensis TaxID=57001 RepID=UPI003C7D61F1
MPRRIGLLTLPLTNNYGGLLQAAALTQTLMRAGHHVVLFNIKWYRPPAKAKVVELLERIPGQNIGGFRGKEMERQPHYPFIRKFIPNVSANLRGPKQLAEAVERHKLDTVIVGSDQVWRFKYHGDGQHGNFFLGFLGDRPTRRISYAASFGVDTWGHPDHTARISDLLGKFDAVSVREGSGVRICAEDLGRSDARVTLDPTLLIDPGFYDEVVETAPASKTPTVLAYVLDKQDLAKSVGEKAVAALGGKHDLRQIRPGSGADATDVPTWLRAFMDADVIITDSFHGTAFAILFGKTFVAIPNQSRGLERFVSLLDAVGLPERLLTDDDESRAETLLTTPIDYGPVTAKLDALRAESKRFLEDALRDEA